MPSIELITAEQLKDLPPTEILEGTKFIARGFNVVFGSSGAFKSFYTLDAALMVAQTAPVVYVAAEGAGGLNRRVLAWCKHHGLTAGQLYFVCQEVNLLNVTQVADLLNTVKDIKPVFIIFDTLARCIPGGDENTAKDMGIAIQNTAMLQRALDCSVAWVHHSNRAERGERGSGAMRGAADAMIEIVANGDGIIRVICSKLKDEEPWVTEDLRFHAIDSSGVLVAGGEGSHNMSAHETAVLEFLALEIFEESGATARQIVSGTNISERSIYRILSHLKHELTITHGSKGDPYRISELGRYLVCQPAVKVEVAKNAEKTV